MKQILIFVCLMTALGRGRADEIDSLMKAANQVGGFNGTALVAYKGKVVFEGALGFADSTKARQLSTDNVFYVGSIAKEFDGAGILLLQEEGKLSVTDKVSKYLPEYPWAAYVEVGQLIDYTSGLPDMPDLPDCGMHDWLMKLAAPAMKPGTTYVYSYANVYLQQKIIEHISGLPYQDFVRSRLLRPCGVSDVPVIASRIALPFTNSFKPVATDQGLMMFTAKDLFVWMNCLSANKVLHVKSLYVLAMMLLRCLR